MLLEGTVTFMHATSRWPALLTLGFYVRAGHAAQ